MRDQFKPKGPSEFADLEEVRFLGAIVERHDHTSHAGPISSWVGVCVEKL